MWKAGTWALIGCLATLCSSRVHGQESAVEPARVSGGALLDQYRAGELHVRFAYWRGLDLYRGTQRTDLGYFGGNYRDIFNGSSAALESMSTFRTYRIVGTTAYAIGMGALVAGIVLLGTESDWMVRKDRYGKVESLKPLYPALLGGGAIAGLGGAFLMVGANTYLSDAVDQYNEDFARRLRSRAAVGIGRAFGLGFKGRF
jgi:MFS family permease